MVIVAIGLTLQRCVELVSFWSKLVNLLCETAPRWQEAFEAGQVNRPRTHKIQPNVRISPKATELPRGSEMTLWGQERTRAPQQNSDHIQSFRRPAVWRMVRPSA